MALTLLGGRLAVEFANTVLTDSAGENGDADWAFLLGFLASSGVISPRRAEALAILPEVAPVETRQFARKAQTMWRAIRKALSSRINGTELEPSAISEINSVLAYTEGYERLEPAEPSNKSEADWQLRLAARSEGVEWLLTAIARSAAEIIAEGPMAPVRRCANPACGLYFYDDSRTSRRRWCSMATCGNRAKVAAHYARSKTR